MLPETLHMRYEAGHDQDIQLAAAVGLIRQMRARALDVACGRNRVEQRRRSGVHECRSRGFGCNPEFVMQPLYQRRVVPLRRTAIA